MGAKCDGRELHGLDAGSINYTEMNMKSTVLYVTPCSSEKARRFGEYIASIFRTTEYVRQARNHKKQEAS
jgi:hypothetical protein